MFIIWLKHWTPPPPPLPYYLCLLFLETAFVSVLCAAFSLCDVWFFSLSSQFFFSDVVCARIWSVETGLCVQVLTAHLDLVTMACCMCDR